MTAMDLRSNTLQMLDLFDQTDAALWQKVHDAIASIYNEEEYALAAKREQQKAAIRQMVGILGNVGDDWKKAKEDYLSEKYQ